MLQIRQSPRCACRARSPGGDSKALLQAAAHLYQLQGRFDLALAILLRLQQPDTFEFVTKHSLLPLLRPSHVASLVRIDEVRSGVGWPKVTVRSSWSKNLNI